MDVRICVVLVVLGGTFARTGKGYYCRDPDTGKLHDVNTTWPASTFCGNYTCKLRIKHPNSSPVREFAVSDVDLSDDKITQIENLSQTVLEKTEEEIRMSNILDTILSDIYKINKTGKGNQNQNENKKDRYLNDKEIKLISNILHSVKKSDLEAIVDIYNLAQDIYKELDKKTSEILDEETNKEIQSSGILNKIYIQDGKKLSTNIQKQAHGKPSYWYEPLQISPKARPLLDSNSEGSEIIASVYPAKKYNSPVGHGNHISLHNNEKQPLLYELSDFQRLSSYMHPTPPHSNVPEKYLKSLGTEKSPIVPRSTVSSPRSYENQYSQQPLLMPFPYYPVHFNTYNATGYPYQYYYSANPYHDVYRTHYNKYYASPVPATEQINVPERSYTPGHLLGSLLPKDDSKKKKPDWKTDSLADEVIEDIRGHIEKNMLFKPLCLRKKVKLEKVGKVFKIEDGKRDKRSTSQLGKEMVNGDLFEAYIERTTCLSDVDPGFFRMGNDTAPYPACCPQRIS